MFQAPCHGLCRSSPALAQTSAADHAARPVALFIKPGFFVIVLATQAVFGCICPQTALGLVLPALCFANPLAPWHTLPVLPPLWLIGQEALLVGEASCCQPSQAGTMTTQAQHATDTVLHKQAAMTIAEKQFSLQRIVGSGGFPAVGTKPHSFCYVYIFFMFQPWV